MEILRVTRDAWGQEVLEGVSWDLLPVFILAGVVIVVGHAVVMWVLSRKAKTE